MLRNGENAQQRLRREWPHPLAVAYEKVIRKNYETMDTFASICS
jgi:hypothetical protein